MTQPPDTTESPTAGPQLRGAWRYIAAWALVVASALGSVAIANALIDPFGAYTIGLDQLDPYRSGRSRSVKASLAASAAPAPVIIGSSRAEAGYRPDHAGLGHDAINLGLRGTNMWETTHVLDTVLAGGAPERVVLCLDFLMFSDGRRFSDDFMESGFNPDLHPISTELETLLSLRAAKASIRVLQGRLSRKPTGSSLTDGFDTRSVDQISGPQRAVFERVLKQFASNPQTYGGYNASDERYDRLRSALARCRAAEIDTVVLINPIHASQLELIHALGLWDAFETFKQRVAQITLDELGRPAFDFAIAGVAQTEPIPAASDSATRMRWYFESSHFQPSLGVVVLDAALADEQADLTASLGARLDDADLDAHLATCRELQARWRSVHPDDAAMAAAIAADHTKD